VVAVAATMGGGVRCRGYLTVCVGYCE